MRQLWSEHRRRLLMRQVWVAHATAQHEVGLVSAEQLHDLQTYAQQIDIDRAHQIEAETQHDVMAEIRTFAEQATIGGGIIHWGLTSEDINDNAHILRVREGLHLLEEQLRELLTVFVARIEQSADLPVMAHTHIQPAEPTTLGYRFAVYAQDLSQNWHDVQTQIAQLRGKGLKGAVGTQASFVEMMYGSAEAALALEARAMQLLDLTPYPIATQTYTRQQDWRILNVLAGIAASLHKFAYDFRILQSPPFGEWAEPFGKKQVGSSAMPFKRNPINMENVCSLARYVAAQTDVAWNNASQAILERSLDDSANRRLIFPETFLATSEMLRKTIRVVKEMHLDEQGMARNLAIYGPFAATERVLMVLVARGASRQEGHEWIRAASLQAWEEVKAGRPNPLTTLLQQDEEVSRWLSAEEIAELMVASAHTGTAPHRARQFAHNLRQQLI